MRVAVQRGERAASGVTSVTAVDPDAVVVVRGPAGPTGPTGPAGPTFSGGTVATAITAPGYVIASDPARILDQRITRTVSPGANPVAGQTWDLFKFVTSGGDRGFFDITLAVTGSGYGQSAEFKLPFTYAMDWLVSDTPSAYGYTSATNPFVSGNWVTLTPTVFTGRHLMHSATALNLQARVVNNEIFFRLWLRTALTGIPTFGLTFRHDQGIANATTTAYTTSTTGVTGPFNTLPNFITSKGGTTSVWNPLGVRTNSPAYPLDVNDQAIFRGNVGFHGATPSTKATVTGSRGGNAALTSLLTALAAKGLITDGTTA